MTFRPTILLIDDDDDDRDIFAIALKTASPDARLITAQHGPEALEKLEKDSLVPDFIFIDLNMPYMHGNVLLAQLRQKPEYAGVPAIIYTTSSSREDAENAKNNGAIHFLVKPTSLSTLSGILKEILDGSATQYFIEA